MQIGQQIDVRKNPQNLTLLQSAPKLSYKLLQIIQLVFKSVRGYRHRKHDRNYEKPIQRL